MDADTTSTRHDARGEFWDAFESASADGINGTCDAPVRGKIKKSVAAILLLLTSSREFCGSPREEINIVNQQDNV